MEHSRNGFTKATAPKKNFVVLNPGTVAWYGPARPCSLKSQTEPEEVTEVVQWTVQREDLLSADQ
jgi:hypothetical protein